MNKKVMRGLAAALAAIGVYKLVQSQNGEREEREVWTTDDMPDLSGKVIIVTGANSGIGLEAAKAFARKGAQTVLACRSMEKAAAALTELQAEVPEAKAETMQLDLASLASVRQFADSFKAKYGRLDILVNNAGIMMVPYGTTEDGFERQLGTNHLGHFALTGLLLDLLVNTPESRVVNVSSAAHHRGNMDFDNLMYEGGKAYSPMGAYGRSKLANLLFTYELQRRLAANGRQAIAVAAHPGISSTNLADHLLDQWYSKPLRPLMATVFQSAEMGALPTLRAAVDPAAEGGSYYGPGGRQERKGYPVLVPSNDASHNLDDAQQLWDVSEALTDVKFSLSG